MKKSIGLCCVALAFGLGIAMAFGQTDLAQTPPMGWNSWNHYHDKIDDAIVRAMADALVSTGMRDEGNIYVNIDDTWAGGCDAQGNFRPMRDSRHEGAGNYVHSKGLKFSIYSSPGPKTCGGYEGSYGHEEQGAETYAAWGVDYLKYDLFGLRVQMKAAGSPEGSA